MNKPVNSDTHKDIRLTLQKVVIKTPALHIHKISIEIEACGHTYRTIRHPTIKNSIACFYR